MNLDTITPSTFFSLWKKFCRLSQDCLVENWRKRSVFSFEILRNDSSIVNHIAKELNLNFQKEYYSHDVVFYEDDDIIPESPEGNVWLRRIKIAFEHEHDYARTYQEVCHLATTNCELRVLVTYPECDEFDLLGRYRQILTYNPMVQNNGFLAIFGYYDPSDKSIIWDGYSYTSENWEVIQ